MHRNLELKYHPVELKHLSFEVSLFNSINALCLKVYLVFVNIVSPAFSWYRVPGMPWSILLLSNFLRVVLFSFFKNIQPDSLGLLIGVFYLLTVITITDIFA